MQALCDTMESRCFQLAPGGRVVRNLGQRRTRTPIVPLHSDEPEPLMQSREPGLQAKLRAYRRVVEERAVERQLGKAYMGSLTVPAQPRTRSLQKRRNTVRSPQKCTRRGMHAWRGVETTPASRDLVGVAAKTAVSQCAASSPSVFKISDGTRRGASCPTHPKRQPQQNSSPAGDDVPAPRRLIKRAGSVDGPRCSSQCSVDQEVSIMNNTGMQQAQVQRKHVPACCLGVPRRCKHGLEVLEESQFALRHWSNAVWARFGVDQNEAESAHVARACVKWLATSCSTQRGSFQSLQAFSECCNDLGIQHSVATEIAAKIWAGLASNGSLSVSVLVASIADLAPLSPSRSTTATPGQAPPLEWTGIPGCHLPATSNCSSNASLENIYSGGSNLGDQTASVRFDASIGNSRCFESNSGNDGNDQPLPTAPLHSTAAILSDACDLHDYRLEPQPLLPKTWHQRQEQQQQQPQCDTCDDTPATCLNEGSSSAVMTEDGDFTYLSASVGWGDCSGVEALSEDRQDCDLVSQCMQASAADYDDMAPGLRRLQPGESLTRPQSTISFIPECRSTTPTNEHPDFDSPLGAISLEADFRRAEMGATGWELEGLRTTGVLLSERSDCRASEALCRERAESFVASICSQALASRSSQQQCDSQRFLGHIVLDHFCPPVFHNYEAPTPSYLLDCMAPCSPSPGLSEFAPSWLVAEPSPPQTPWQVLSDDIFNGSGLYSSTNSGQSVQPLPPPCATKPEELTQHVGPA
mmetsp:Transcript_92417/g.178114  ORF Transcript_92417/g.178114 Transcript_92417/m.178114 type:complete len:753 (+) Transcript_92417:62-2320(+)